MGNSRGSYRSKRTNSMAAYDALPASVRHALANAQFAWAPQQVRTRFNRGHMTAKQLVASVPQWDAQHAAKTRVRTWGKDYPA